MELCLETTCWFAWKSMVWLCYRFRVDCKQSMNLLRELNIEIFHEIKIQHKWRLTFRVCRLWTERRVKEVKGSENSSDKLSASDYKCHVLKWTSECKNRHQASCHKNRQHWTSTLPTLVADLLQQNFPLRSCDSNDNLKSFGENFQQC